MNGKKAATGDLGQNFRDKNPDLSCNFEGPGTC